MAIVCKYTLASRIKTAQTLFGTYKKNKKTKKSAPAQQFSMHEHKKNQHEEEDGHDIQTTRVYHTYNIACVLF